MEPSKVTQLFPCLVGASFIPSTGLTDTGAMFMSLDGSVGMPPKMFVLFLVESCSDAANIEIHGWRVLQYCNMHELHICTWPNLPTSQPNVRYPTNEFHAR
jgi:hypothetical protein